MGITQVTWIRLYASSPDSAYVDLDLRPEETTPELFPTTNAPPGFSARGDPRVNALSIKGPIAGCRALETETDAPLTKPGLASSGL